MKVLIVSHNPLSTYQSMGKTMLSLFSEFKREELFQLYVYPSVPDVDKCQSYYRVTDKAVAKGVFTRKVASGVIEPNLGHHTKFENDEDRVLYNNPKNSGSFRLLARDIMWKVSPWWNNGIKKWLDEIKPDCIFLAPGNCSFIYNIALKIAKTYEISIVSYICDEYYFVKTPTGVLERIRSNMVRKKIAEAMRKSDGIVTICKELEAEYGRGFDKKAITIMTGTNHKISTQTQIRHPINSIIFMGNLACNRENSAYDIGIALDEINSDNGTNYRLIIYTGVSDTIKNKLSSVESIELHGFISGEEFEKVFWNAEMFLHIEDFHEDSIDRVKHSVSTKIADIMASGIPMFAYGPGNIASMGHLVRNDCAICVTDKGKLKASLLKAFSDRELREKKAKNGLKVAECYHNPNQDGIRLHQFLEEQMK